MADYSSALLDEVENRNYIKRRFTIAY